MDTSATITPTEMAYELLRTSRSYKATYDISEATTILSGAEREKKQSYKNYPNPRPVVPLKLELNTHRIYTSGAETFMSRLRKRIGASSTIKSRML